MNRRAVPRLRVDRKLAADSLQPLHHVDQAEHRPAHRVMRIKASARVLDGQADGIDVTGQGDVGASRHTMLEDVLDSFMQHAVEAKGDFRRQRIRHVLELHLNGHILPIRPLLAESGHRCRAWCVDSATMIVSFIDPTASSAFTTAVKDPANSSLPADRASSPER